MNIFLDTIGCRLNQSEIEKMASQFRAAGHTIVSKAKDADWVVINTCAVTTAAASDSRQAIRQAAKAGAGKIISTGCWATLDTVLALKLPGVVKVVPNLEKDNLVSSLLDLDVKRLQPVERCAIPGDRSRTRGFIKVQDGCNNACTFCITRIARGRSRSRTLEEILQDIDLALAGGVNEIVLTGVHLGAWGKDFSSSQPLSYLIESILQKTSVPRLRLSSLEPWDIEDHLFSLWTDRRLCPHFHLPLQSGSTKILRRMARKTTLHGFMALVDKIINRIPQAAISTDIIVGFPGETDEEFLKSLSFIRQVPFSAGHVFHFSPRPGTPAYDYPDRLPKETLKERSRICRQLFAEKGKTFNLRHIGDEADVLWESARQNPDGSWTLEGWTPHYIRVRAQATERLWNHESHVRLLAPYENGLLGDILTKA